MPLKKGQRSSSGGDTKLVVSERRPVPLEQHVLVQADDHTEPELPTLYRRDAQGEQTTKLNVRLIDRLDQLDRQAAPPRRRTHAPAAASIRGATRRRSATRPSAGRWSTSSTISTCSASISYSRNGCDQAVEQCIIAGLELTTEDEMRHPRHRRRDGRRAVEPGGSSRRCSSPGSGSRWRRASRPITPACRAIPADSRTPV